MKEVIEDGLWSLIPMAAVSGFLIGFVIGILLAQAGIIFRG